MRPRSSQFRGWAPCQFWGVGRTHRRGKDPGREEDPHRLWWLMLLRRPGRGGFPVGDRPAEGAAWSPVGAVPRPLEGSRGGRDGDEGQEQRALGLPPSVRA